MSKTINVNDLILISDYIDGRLPAPEMEKLSTRVSNDPEFRQAFQEITYTRAMLRALPHKRAPRNFTLSPNKYRKPARNGWLQPAFSFVSIASAIALVVTFGSTFLLGNARMAAAPAMESDFAMAPMAESATEATPMILNWNPQVANGMGGGGGDAYSSGVYTGGDGVGGAGGPGWVTVEPIPNAMEPTPDPLTGSGGGAPTEAPLSAETMLITEVPPETTAPLVTEAPLVLEEPDMKATEPPLTTSAEDAGLSKMILGVPEQGTEGQILTTELPRERATTLVNPRALIMIAAAALMLGCGLAALLLRRR